MVFREEEPGIVASDSAGLPVAARNGHLVTSYVELLQKVAALNYHNSRLRLLFRGQSRDYKFNIHGDQGIHSCLYPSLLRPTLGIKREEALDQSFAKLKKAEDLLKDAFFVEDIHRHQLIRWAILQHYEVCSTPLLDVTLSLQSALSFALQGEVDDGYLFVLAFPQLTGPVSVALESMTQVVDLCQVCPPEALRPHFQAGLLVGDYPLVTSRELSHDKRAMIGNNFACRLLTKFHLSGCRGWLKEGFAAIASNILYPNSHDSWYRTMLGIKMRIYD